MTSVNAIFLCVAAIAIASGAQRIHRLRRHGSGPGLVAQCILFITFALALICLSPVAQGFENRLYPNMGRLLANCSTMAAAFGLLTQYHIISLPVRSAGPRNRLRLIVVSTVVAAMVILFLGTPLPPTIGEFGHLYVKYKGLTLYIAIYIAYLGWAFVSLGVLCLRRVRTVDQRSMKTGLLIIVIACLVGTIYLAEKAWYVTSEWIGIPALPGHDRPCTSVFSPAGCAFAISLPVLTVLLIAVGLITPPVVVRLTALKNRIGNGLDYRRLYPLWEALYSVEPQIHLGQFPDTPRIEFKLYREVIEIHDGLLALRAYIDPQIQERAEMVGAAGGLGSDQKYAAGDAAIIAEAIRLRRSGGTPYEHSRSDAPHMTSVADLADIDFRKEISALKEIARAFRRQ